jgi:hypothetical protein
VGAPSDPSAERPRERGGVLLSYWESDDRTALAFVPADVAARLCAISAITDVPGTRPPARGLALADGEVVTVLEIGRPRPAGLAAPSYEPGTDRSIPGSDRAVLCALGSTQVALLGGTVVATGLFDAAEAEDGVLWRGDLVRTLDVRALYAQAETAIWAERAVSSHPAAGRRTSAPPSPQRPRTSRPPPVSEPKGEKS